jgi:LAGLIDADG DNA endonuclease family
MKTIMNNIYLNLIYGLLLGESFMAPEGGKNNKEIKLIIKIEGKHISYMKEIHKLISNLGYCEKNLPKIITKLGKKGKLKKLMLLHTYNNIIYLDLYNK